MEQLDAPDPAPLARIDSAGGGAPDLDIEPEFRDEFARDLAELTATLDAIVGQYAILLGTQGVNPITGDMPQTPDRATATIAKMGDRMAQVGIWESETVHRLLAVAVRRIHERDVETGRTP